MGIPLRVLIAEDSEADMFLLVRDLRRAGYEPSYERVDDENAMRAALLRQSWDLVIGDYSMPHFSGPAALALLREHDPDVPFIFVSGTIGEDVAVEAMKAGAQDYVIKGNLKRLIPAVARELKDAEVRRERRLAQSALLVRARLAELNADIGAALASGGALRATLQRCAEALVNHLDVAFARVWTMNSGASTLELQASAGLYTRTDGEYSRITVGTGKIGAIARDGRPVLTNQVLGDPDVRDQEWARQEGMVAFAGYPLIARDRVLGVMAMFARQPLSDFVPTALGSVANAIAVGIERRLAERALHESEKRFAKIFQASPVGIAITTPAGRWLDANDAFLRIVGHTREELLGPQGPDIGLLPPPGERAHLVQRLRAGPAPAADLTIQAKDGGTRDVLASLELIDIGGEPCVLALAHDVTRQRGLERQLLQAQKMEAVGRLAGGVAHDFNNLLTVISSYADLLLEDLRSDDPRRPDAMEIRQAAQRATELTRQLLAFSRQQVLQPKVLDLNAVVGATENMLRRLLGEDIELVMAFDAGVGAVRADPGQVEQVILNLAVNARDAMPRGGRLTIETRNAELGSGYLAEHAVGRPGLYTMLSVSDTGVGMDEATKGRIFEPFFTTKEPGKGTGLGLSTVYGIINQSDGIIWVYSEPGRGTSFKIYLPRVDEPVDRERAADKPATDLPRGTETVLVVEDAAPVRTVARQMLERLGYTVLEALDGQAAFDLAAEHRGRIDLLLTDVVMPALSGRELAERLAPVRPDMRVLFMSGYTDDSVVRHGVLQAGVAYLQKPFTPEGLGRKVREVLDTPRP